MSRLRHSMGSAWRTLATVALATGLAVPIWGPVQASAQALLPPTASAAPESAIVYHQVDLDREGVQWQQVEELLARVGVPDALEMFEAEILAEGARQGDITETDLDALLGGEMAIVVSPPAVDHMMSMMTKMGDYHDGKGNADDDENGTSGQEDAVEVMGTPVAFGPGSATGIVAVLQPGDSAAAWEYVQRQFSAVAAETGVSVLDETNDGDALLVIEPGKWHGDDESGKDKDKGYGKDKDKDKDKGKSKGDKDHAGRDGMMDKMDGYPFDARYGIVAARAGAFIVAGMTRDDVNAIVDVIQGESASLVESMAAQRVYARMPDESVSFTYVNGAELLDALDPEMVADWAESMGDAAVTDARAYSGLAISAEPAGFRFDTIMIPAEGGTLATAGLTNDPDILARAEQAPAGTFLFHAGDLPENAFAGAAYGLASALTAAEEGDDWGMHGKMMAPPSAEEMREALAEASAMLGFDPQADLFDLLGRDFVAMASLPTFTMTGFGWDAVAAIGTSDAAALAETAQKVAAFIERSDENVDVSTRDANGDTVFVVTDPEMGESPGLEFGVVGDRAVVGIGGGIGQLDSAPAENLAGDAQFQAVMSSLPSEAYQIGYVDFGQLIDLVMGFMAMGADDGTATPVATGAGSPENIRALGAVAFTDGGSSGSSAILYIAGAE